MENSYNFESNFVLKSIEKIAHAFKDSDLSDHNKRKILNGLKEEIKIVGSFLHCGEDEAWLFSVMFAMNISGKDADMDSLTHYLNCNPFLIVSLSPVLDSLVHRRLLVRNTGYDMKVVATRFNISSYVYNAISLNKNIPQSNQFEDVFQVIERVNEMICERERNNVPTDDLFNEALNLLEKEKHFSLIKRLLSMEFSGDDTLLLIYLCYSYANDSNEADIERYVYYVYDSMGSKIRAKKNLLSGRSRLVEEDWACFVEDGFYGGRELSLTDKAIEFLFAEEANLGDKNKSFNPKNCVVFTPDKIRTAPLYFNEKENKQIDLIAKLLSEENYQTVVQRLKNAGMLSGITALFYGEPGTGKTQVAYNLAQQTNRVLLMVDIAAIRDKYVGESEKRIKQIFKTYKQAKSYYDQCPILFFNESDALISKRYEVNSSIDQMNNSMQNILLQELEDFEGILVATSNMNQNLDAAFERRFLYKIQFEKPDYAIRTQIWQAKMPELTQEAVELLAADFQLTGGQINNISRKYLLTHILHDSTPNLTDLHELCQSELFGTKRASKVGF